LLLQPISQTAARGGNLSLLAPGGWVPSLVVRPQQQDQLVAVGVAEDSHEEAFLSQPELEHAAAQLTAKSGAADSYPLLL